MEQSGNGAIAGDRVAPDAAAPVLNIQGLWKYFGSTPALAGVDLVVRGGEVHGLLGQNGSGKSTLIKVLAGFHVPDSFSLLESSGQPVRMPINEKEHRAHGWRFVHQDLGLIEDLTVLDNFELVGFEQSTFFRLHTAAERSAALEALERFEVDVPINAVVGELPPGERAMIALARAAQGLFSGRALGGLLLLDEPTTFLPDRDADKVFQLIRRIAQMGGGVLIVSHRISEVRRVCDTVTVLRDGRVVGNGPTSQFVDEEIVEMIMGRRDEPERVAAGRPAAAPPPAAVPVLRVAGLVGERVGPASFDVAVGEVLGLTGLMGAGYDVIARLLYGAVVAVSGSIAVAGAAPIDAARFSPVRAREAGIAFIPADRRRQGGAVDLSLAENISLPIIGNYFQKLRLRRRKERYEAVRLLVEYDVSTHDSRTPFGALSGGNQQKVLLAKWLQVRPDLLLLDEPTQGLDVGARGQVVRLIRSIASGGTGVVLASADLDTIVATCDRVLVVHEGRLTSELTGADVTRELVVAAVYRSPQFPADQRETA
jgi:ribose transport system ATP-binding protein